MVILQEIKKSTAEIDRQCPDMQTKTLFLMLWIHLYVFSEFISKYFCLVGVSSVKLFQPDNNYRRLQWFKCLFVEQMRHLSPGCDVIWELLVM